VAYHELGHAIWPCPSGTDPVQKITVIPRGIAAWLHHAGAHEDRFLMSKTELENKIASLLGGRAAEQIVSGDISTGAHNDLSGPPTSPQHGQGIRHEQRRPVYYAPNRRAQFLAPCRKDP